MKRIIGICFLLLLSDFVMSQAIIISPSNPSPNSLYILAPVNAGTKPTNPLTNYTGQYISYLFPTGWGNIGQVDVNSTSIPGGMEVIIQAANGIGYEGNSTGPVTLSSTYTPIIDGIAKVRRTITRQLTQSIVISDADFSNLHPGQYILTINLWIH